MLTNLPKDVVTMISIYIHRHHTNRCIEQYNFRYHWKDRNCRFAEQCADGWFFTYQDIKCVFDTTLSVYRFKYDPMCDYWIRIYTGASAPKRYRYSSGLNYAYGYNNKF